MNDSPQLPARQASLFGKLPTVLDYVRINHSYPAAIALDEWLSRALQDLTLASLSWPSARYRFLFAPSVGDHAIVGVFGPSRDRAGRKFPLSVFVPMPVSDIGRSFAALPFACQELFFAADQLLDDAASLSRDDAADKLASLPLPTLQALGERRATLREALEQRPMKEFAGDLFADSIADADHALVRAESALEGARGRVPERGLTLDCPVATTADVGAWLSLAERVLDWPSGVPSLFWTEAGEPGRLLISLGAPPATLPLWLADRKRKSDRLVTLGTVVPGYGRAEATASYAADEAADSDLSASGAASGTSLWDKLEALHTDA